MLSFITLGQNDRAAAEALALRALALLEAFSDLRGTARAHWALANAIVMDGRYADARAHYQTGLAIARDISDLWFVPWCLVGLAEIAVCNGDPLQAVRLLAALSLLAGDEFVPCLRPQAKRTSAAVRAAINESSWAAAWQVGRQLSYEEAVDEGLAVEPPTAPKITSRIEVTVESPLTVRELEVARLIARGLTNKNIAAELAIAEGTADRHVANILSKLEFASRAQIAAWFVSRRR